jgi:hypothetical protein
MENFSSQPFIQSTMALLSLLQMFQKSLAKHRAREKWLMDTKAWEELFQEMWYLNQEEEPLNHLGQSVLFRWLNPFETEERRGWSCGVPLENEKWCTHTISRPDRAVTHVRGHLGHKPYACEGVCGNQYWYAEKPLPHEKCINTATSTARFGSNENRSAHYQGPERRLCEWW